MKLWIALVIAFVALVFVYNLIKNKKRRRNYTDTVIEFQTKYRRDRKVKKTEGSEYGNYITKYNSNVDYIERGKDS